MIAYIQTDKNGNYFNVNAYLANEGFVYLGWETRKYFQINEIKDKNPEDIVVGGIGNVRMRLKQLGIVLDKDELEYPPELSQYLGRKIWKSTLHELISNEKNWNIFIKPVETKNFTGKIIHSLNDFIDIMNLNTITHVWCSEIVNFVTEWRCFIRYGEILDIRQYNGAWDSKLNLEIIKNAVSDFTQAPSAYAMDFGIDEKGIFKLVEINDGHSLGTYGLSAVNYAKLLSARWAELTNTKDYNNF